MEATVIYVALQAVTGGAALGGVLAETSLVTKVKPHNWGEVQAHVCWMSFPSLFLHHMQSEAFITCLQNIIHYLPALVKGHARNLTEMIGWRGFYQALEEVGDHSLRASYFAGRVRSRQ